MTRMCGRFYKAVHSFYGICCAVHAKALLSYGIITARTVFKPCRLVRAEPCYGGSWVYKYSEAAT